jgi:sugar/nucleoside kinase (ribokinase family)
VLCAVGDLIEDIVVQLHGDINRDTDTPAAISRRRGGSAANVAYFAAKLSGRSRFIGCVGDDPLGDSLITQLSQHGVDVRGERHGHTGSIVVVTTSDGNRTMLTDRGSATELQHCAPEWLSGVRVLHVPLYSLSNEPLRSSATTAVRFARTNGATVSIDLSSVALIEQLGVPAVHALLNDLSPDVLFCTRSEADAIAVSRPHHVSTRQVVVKDGAHPIRVLADDGSERTFAVDAHPQVVDATGAGDAFAAGFLTALSNGGTVDECVDEGRTLAARVVMLPGATLENQ